MEGTDAWPPAFLVVGRTTNTLLNSESGEAVRVFIAEPSLKYAHLQESVSLRRRMLLRHCPIFEDYASGSHCAWELTRGLYSMSQQRQPQPEPNAAPLETLY